MTNEEIIELAKHQKWLGNADGWTFNSRQQLITFARRIAAMQKEKDAGIALANENRHRITAERIAAAIRSQSDE